MTFDYWKRLSLIGVSIGIFLLTMLVATPQLAIANSIQVCRLPGNCVSENTLQDAFNRAVNQDANYDVEIRIPPGIYSNSGTSVQQVKDQIMRQACAAKSEEKNLTGFLLKGRTKRTIIRGTGLNPGEVVIWGRVPSSVSDQAEQADSNPGGHHPAFHALTIQDNSGNVEIRNLSIFSDGGLHGNYLGDASLNILNSKGTVENVIVSANKNAAPSNPLYNGAGNHEENYVDQEGIVLYGKNTDFTIRDSLIFGNFHTGIMAMNGAKTLIVGSYIRGNGWGAHDFQATNKGHGVTTFSDCTLNESGKLLWDNNTQTKVWNSIFVANSGTGILLRGVFSGGGQGLVNNTLFDNRKHGIAIGGWQDPDSGPTDTILTNGHTIFIANNQIVGQDQTGIFRASNVTINGGNINVQHNNYHANNTNISAGLTDPYINKNRKNPGNQFYTIPTPDATFMVAPSVLTTGWGGVPISSYHSQTSSNKFKLHTINYINYRNNAHNNLN